MYRFVVAIVLIAIGLSAVPSFAQTAVADPPATETKEDKKQKKKQARKEAKKKAAEAKDKQKKADEDADHDVYARVHKDDSGKLLALQTAVVRFIGNKGSKYEGRVVDLVGVVHIGENKYYRDLNSRLATYDTVLYELVAPDGTRIRPEDLKQRRSILSSMQSGMKDMLNLEYQLEKIDYLAKNFRHADMTPEEFAEDFKRRGDSVWKMMARMMGAGLASQASTGGDAGLLLALMSDDRSRKMKQIMARQVIDLELINAGISDKNGENTLIKGRNAKCFRILKEELDGGKKSVAVFYGAGHLPDMAERLKDDFGMKPIETTWMDGWDLTKN